MGAIKPRSFSMFRASEHLANGHPADDLSAFAPKSAGQRAPERNVMARTSSLIAFVILVVGGGLAVGFLTAPGTWYAELAKPSFNPPNWVFGPVWAALYVLIAVAGWRTWRRDRRAPAMTLWWAQLVLNFLWSPVFFSAHRIDLALVVILLLIAAILAFVWVSWRPDRLAAGLFGVYAIWVAFASVLNASILALN
jgi:benzodiazapine receptor